MEATRIVRVVLTAGLLAGVGMAQGLAVAAASSGGNHTKVIFVSREGASANAGESCETARYRTIQSAVNAAPKWATVVVCRGTYAGDVVVSSPLTLKGRDATIKGTATTAFLCDQLARIFQQAAERQAGNTQSALPGKGQLRC